MSTTIRILTTAFFIGIILSCQPDDDFPDLENPLAIKPSLLQGTWVAEKVVQYDQEALDNGFPTEVVEQDITALFPFSQYRLTFSLDEAGRPGTYTITAGEAPNFLNLNNGDWTLDNPVFATVISMSNTSDVNAASFRIRQLDADRITLHVLRNDATDNTLYSYYEYDFVKSN
jgi:hypothetical protein